jgi:vesicle coat complex subunit
MNNTIIKDLQSDNTFIIMTTLTMLRYFLSDNLIPHLLPLLSKLLKHPTSIIRRKTFLVMLDIYQRYNHHVPDLKRLTIDAINDSESPVIFAGLSMLYPQLMSDPHHFKDLTPRLV